MDVESLTQLIAERDNEIKILKEQNHKYKNTIAKVIYLYTRNGRQIPVDLVDGLDDFPWKEMVEMHRLVMSGLERSKNATQNSMDRASEVMAYQVYADSLVSKIEKLELALKSAGMNLDEILYGD